MYNIIGDIHGLDRWKQLVREDASSTTQNHGYWNDFFR